MLKLQRTALIGLPAASLMRPLKLTVYRVPARSVWLGFRVTMRVRLL